MLSFPDCPASLKVAAQVRARLADAFALAQPGITVEIRVDCAGLPRLPARLVRWLLLTVMPTSAATVTRLALWHATIEGQVNLIGTKLTVTPCFANCLFIPASEQSRAGLDLSDTTVIGIEVIGGNLGSLRADRLKARGSVLLRGARQDVSYQHDLPADIEPTLVIPHGLTLSGAHIQGNLDLRGADIHHGSDRQSGKAVAILADGMSVDGNLLLSDGARVVGEVRLNGSRIHRNLDCAGAQLSNIGGYCLSAAGAEIKGSIYFHRTRSVGSLRLEGARIQGDLNAADAMLTATAFFVANWVRVRTPTAADNEEDLVALHAAGADVAGDVLLKDAFEARGGVNLIATTIGGDLNCSGGGFHFPGEQAFYADGATIGGAAYFSNGSTTGLIRFVQAQIKQGCYLDDFAFDLGGRMRGWQTPDPSMVQNIGSNLAGVDVTGADIGGALIWTNIHFRTTNAVPAEVDGAPHRVTLFAAPGATLAEIADDEYSWDVLDRIDLQNCVYQHIDGLTTDVAWRLRRLDREYASWNLRPDWKARRLAWEVLRRTRRGEQHGDNGLGAQVQRFMPGPYLQLARAYRNAGLETAAQAVLLQLERNRACYGGLTVRGVLWRWLIDLALRYGLSPFRPVAFVMVWTAVSGLLFQRVYSGHGIHEVNGTNDVAFSGFFYALDTLIPFVDFGQRKQFVIEPVWSCGGLLLLVNTFLGYAAASFFAAGLSGLVRIGKNDN